MEPAVYLIVGYPGTGKYTVGKALRAELDHRGRETRLVDNHHINNAIFGVIPADGVGELPDRVWDLVTDVRRAVLTAVDELAPVDWSFVFTNFISQQEAAGRPVVTYLERLDRLAAARGSRLRVVRLTCERDELLRRVVNLDRRERLKASSPEWLAGVLDTTDLYDGGGLPTLTLDVTHLPPADAARAVVEHAWE